MKYNIIMQLHPHPPTMNTVLSLIELYIGKNQELMESGKGKKRSWQKEKKEKVITSSFLYRVDFPLDLAKIPCFCF